MVVVGALGGPLSWKEARSRLRVVLEEYLDNPLPSRKKESEERSAFARSQNHSLIARWIHHDLDLFFGALLLSLTLLAVSCFSLTKRRDGVGSSLLHVAASITVYRAQVAAGSLLVVGSLLSLWMVRRRKFLRLTDTDSGKKREIIRFLRRLDKEEAEEEKASGGQEDSSSDYGLHLPGTALTDIYAVCRKTSSDNSTASWTRLPSLLLVEGDYIALQVGDVAPANCVMVDKNPKTGHTIHISAGENISVSTNGDTLEDVLSQLPSDRTTLPPDSKLLLPLCNGMRIYIVAKAPIHDFLRRPEARARSSQMSRKLLAMRITLSLVAMVFLVLTTIIVFSRPGAVSGDLSMLIPMPLLAALGVLPVVGPAFVFFLEMVGTARILTTVHPYTSSSSKSGGDDESHIFSETRLLLRYLVATLLTRLSLWEAAGRFQDFLARLRLIPPPETTSTGLIRVPPASLNILESLAVATAFALVDDELACEPHAVPQQLLIPSVNGLKLLDLCPTYEDDESEDEYGSLGRNGGKTFDSDSSDEGTLKFQGLRRKVLRRKYLRRRRDKSDDDTESTEDSSYEVQFEDPTWWQYLPSLKCIGLCALKNDLGKTEKYMRCPSSNASNPETLYSGLINLLCTERHSYQLRALAQCIGFSCEPNSLGEHGDLTPFKERLRLNILSKKLFRGRLEIDSHERSSEESRWWGRIRPDVTSIVVQDSRSKAYQLLTIGDPSLIASFCNEAWQGDISTILPLSVSTRETMLETTRSWMLGDLDVAAFSYAPVPDNFEKRLVEEDSLASELYLLHPGADAAGTSAKDKNKNAPPEWAMIRNQIFLGVLGSLIVPRKEIQRLLSNLNDAGVRFVYFSPRNMRRQKELASQMGIDVAWNCAISLRPLEGVEEDPHRMVSTYGDWDVNAKLPHGVEDVRKHLEEVDNVPLLVSLFTDVTKQTTKEMVEIFQDYSDTVISIGLSHLPSNEAIFSTSDIAVGIDVLTSQTERDVTRDHSVHGQAKLTSSTVRPSELDFVSAICSHSCPFMLRGASSVSHMARIIEQSRASLEAATAATVFLVTGCVSYSFYVLFAACVPSTTIPVVPTLGSALYLQFVLPGISLTMAMSDAEHETMQRVPPKNDVSITFRKKEGFHMYSTLVGKSILPALLSQVIFLIAYGELIFFVEPELVATGCPYNNGRWVSVIRCEALRGYSGPARTSAGAISLVHFVLCITIASVSFVYRFTPIREQHPWQYNQAWAGVLVLVVCLTAVYASLAVVPGVTQVLPWYYYLLNIVDPCLCLVWNEFLKKVEAKHEKRAEKLRRLQFETRLGAWSPK